MAVRKRTPSIIRYIAVPQQEGKLERVIAGDALPAKRIIGKYRNELSRLSKTGTDMQLKIFIKQNGKLGSRGTSDFQAIQKPAELEYEKTLFKNKIRGSNLSESGKGKLAEKIMAAKSMLYVAGTNVTASNHNISTDLRKRIERIAEHRKIDFIYTDSRNPNSIKVSQKTGWKLLFIDSNGIQFYGKFLKG
ncbi:MAG: hypothetical protein WC602_01265 [archaeon]